MDQTFYNFIYRDSINGFKVTGFIVNSNVGDDGIEGNVVLEFDGNNNHFTILHPCFTIDKEQLDKVNGAYGEENGDRFFTRSGILGFYLDYKVAEGDTTIYKTSVPFFFEDMNADGRKDLILRHPNQGYKVGDKYSVHYCQWSGCYEQEPDTYYDKYTP